MDQEAIDQQKFDCFLRLKVETESINKGFYFYYKSWIQKCICKFNGSTNRYSEFSGCDFGYLDFVLFLRCLKNLGDAISSI